MSTKHTPGPWHSAQDRTLPIEIFTSTGDGDTEERIAVICGGNSAKADANASLIAEAPQLLSDLKDLLDLAERHGLQSYALENARASIARAEGGEQAKERPAHEIFQGVMDRLDALCSVRRAA